MCRSALGTRSAPMVAMIDVWRRICQYAHTGDEGAGPTLRWNFVSSVGTGAFVVSRLANHSRRERICAMVVVAEEMLEQTLRAALKYPKERSSAGGAREGGGFADWMGRYALVFFKQPSIAQQRVSDTVYTNISYYEHSTTAYTLIQDAPPL